MHIAILCLYTNRKKTTAAKMKEVFIANSGKVLIWAADTGRSPEQESRLKPKQTGNTSGSKFQQTAELEFM